ncbi:YhcH/YjgK/YiaL family protein [uncultured Dialister sp.]|uniref:YhcH/YjgK/YiaL family protein n=1 Tax=uncultured Dialister sp. TaxID=278064 RepID=UPI00260E0BA0|nr:YhcH/YjgK/YiaL family protein [uncultured Dialister sp.]
MITGDIHHLEAYEKQLPPFIRKCLSVIRDFDFTAVPDGKYELCGCTMSVESPATEPEEDRKLEGHKKFIDIQYEIKGEEEWIGVESLFDSPKTLESYKDRDLYFFESMREKESKVYFTEGRFAVFFPEDLHRPLCEGRKGKEILRKAVMKVPVEKVR